MKLPIILNDLLTRAEQEGRPVQKSLGRGLYVRATTDPRRLCLWRTEGEWGPGEASEREGHTCAKALGWGSYRLDWSGSGRYLTVEEEGGLL